MNRDLDRKLTKPEKRAIRFMPCGKCHRKPPYEDGSYTQKHRLIPGSQGGKYTKANTVPSVPNMPREGTGASTRLYHADRSGAP